MSKQSLLEFLVRLFFAIFQRASKQQAKSAPLEDVLHSLLCHMRTIQQQQITELRWRCKLTGRVWEPSYPCAWSENQTAECKLFPQQVWECSVCGSLVAAAVCWNSWAWVPFKLWRHWVFIDLRATDSLLIASFPGRSRLQFFAYSMRSKTGGDSLLTLWCECSTYCSLQGLTAVSSFI